MKYIPIDKLKILKPPVIFLFICVPLVFQTCCINEPFENLEYEIPLQTNDNWKTASLESVGLDEVPLLNLLDDLNGVENHNLHSLLTIKNGKLVFEEYFPGEKFELAQFIGKMGFDMYDRHNLCSATKSITSALVGIAIDKGFIESVNQTIYNFYPQYFDIFENSQQKRSLTIEHLLTMRSGITWDDESTSYFEPANDMYQIWRNSDPIRYILEKDLYAIPGIVFNYDNCNTNLLGDIVYQASGDRLDHFAENYLFRKLGITDYKWHYLHNNVVFCSGEIRLRPRDMAKFGQLFLNKGKWNGEQIISEEWVDESTKTFTQLDWGNMDSSFEDGYGYQWWTWDDIHGEDFPAYMAQGWGGQWIIIYPEQDMVIVATGGNYYNSPPLPISRIIVDYILPAL
jgi:CubicO group peptidase (beta-lactamase class C family)